MHGTGPCYNLRTFYCLVWGAEKGLFLTVSAQQVHAVLRQRSSEWWEAAERERGGLLTLFSLKRIIGLWPPDVHHPLQNSRLPVTNAVQQQLRHLHTPASAPPNTPTHPTAASSECHTLAVKPVTLPIHTFICLVPTQRSHRSLMRVISAPWSALFSPQEVN